MKPQLGQTCRSSSSPSGTLIFMAVPQRLQKLHFKPARLAARISLAIVLSGTSSVAALQVARARGLPLPVDAPGGSHRFDAVDVACSMAAYGHDTVTCSDDTVCNLGNEDETSMKAWIRYSGYIEQTTSANGGKMLFALCWNIGNAATYRLGPDPQQCTTRHDGRSCSGLGLGVPMHPWTQVKMISSSNNCIPFRRNSHPITLNTPMY